MKKIAIIIGPKGYQDMEFGEPYKYFNEQGATVDVYSTKKGLATGTAGATFDVKYTLDELNVDNYDAIVFVGGPGTLAVRNDTQSQKIALNASFKNKILAAICWSPTILAKSRVLEGKNATVWVGHDPEFNMQTTYYLESQGAKYTGEDVTIDGNIITANGPGAAKEYAIAIWQKVIEK